MFEYWISEIDDLGIYGPNNDFGEYFYEDITDEEQGG